MKKLIALLLVLVMVLPLCACGSSSPAQETTVPVETTAPEENETGIWSADYSTDEFGDVSYDSDIFLRGLISGDFSNTATSSSDLLGNVFISLNPGRTHFVVAFRLLEYGNHQAKFLDSNELILKTKIGNDVKEYTLTGFAPNSDLLLGIENMDDGDAFFQNLYAGNDIRCIIYIGNSQYNFTVKSANISEAAEEVKQLAQAQVEANKINSVSGALNAILNHEKYGDRYEYLTTHIEDFPVLTNEELSEVITNTWLRITLDNYVYDDWWVFSFSEDGIYSQVGRFLEGEFESTDPWSKWYKVENGSLYFGTNANKEWDYSNEMLNETYEIRKLQDGYYLAVQTEGKGTFSKQVNDYVMKMYIFAQYDENGNLAYPVK